MKKWISSIVLMGLVTGCGTPALVQNAVSSAASPSSNSSIRATSDTTTNQQPVHVEIDFKTNETVGVNVESMSPSILKQSASTVRTGSSVSFVDPQVANGEALIQVSVYRDSQKITTLTSQDLINSNDYEIQTPGTYKFVISGASGINTKSTASATIIATGKSQKESGASSYAPTNPTFASSISAQLNSDIKVKVSNYSSALQNMKIDYSGVPQGYTLEGAYYQSTLQGNGMGLNDFNIQWNTPQPPDYAAIATLTVPISMSMQNQHFRIILTFMNNQGEILVAKSETLLIP